MTTPAEIDDEGSSITLSRQLEPTVFSAWTRVRFVRLGTVPAAIVAVAVGAVVGRGGGGAGGAGGGAGGGGGGAGAR